MPSDIVRHQTPEEVELLRKRQELAAVCAEMAERELELADLRAGASVISHDDIGQISAIRIASNGALIRIARDSIAP